jgi:hypothetical protein
MMNKLSSVLMGVVATTVLTVCPIRLAKSEIVLKKAIKVNISENSIQGTAGYVRPMDCTGVNKVVIRLLAIRAGKTDSLWDGTHRRPAGAGATSSCILSLLLESGVRSKEPNPTVSFRFGSTEGDRNGKKRKVFLPDLATPESWATKEAPSKPVLADKPIVLYARVAGSKDETEKVYDPFFKISSEADVVAVSKQHDKLTFLVVVFSWSPQS